MHGYCEWFIPQEWELDRARNVAYIVFTNKYGQNEDLRNRSVKTGEKLIFEVTADKMWGCGLILNSTTLMDKTSWY